jgi:hypothetical protein
VVQLAQERHQFFRLQINAVNYIWYLTFVGADIITDLAPALICFILTCCKKKVLNYYINIVFFPGNSSGLRTELY